MCWVLELESGNAPSFPCRRVALDVCSEPLLAALQLQGTRSCFPPCMKLHPHSRQSWQLALEPGALGSMAVLPSWAVADHNT